MNTFFQRDSSASHLGSTRNGGSVRYDCPGHSRSFRGGDAIVTASVERHSPEQKAESHKNGDSRTNDMNLCA